MTYPTAIPDYNLFRNNSADAVDVAERAVIVLELPQGLSRYVYGQLSLLCDINAWRKLGALSPADMVDLFCNEVSLDMGFCELVLGCVVGNADVQAAIQNVVDGLGESDASVDAIATTSAEELDCVWGGAINLADYLFGELEAILDALDSAASVSDAVGDYLPATGYAGLAKVAFNTFDLIASQGTAAIRATLTQSNKDRIACSFFCYVVNNVGVGGLVTNEVILGWGATLSDSSQPDGVIRWLIEGVSVSPFLDPVQLLDRGRLISYYVLGLNDCSDDWLVLCACETWEYEYDFLESSCGATPRTTDVTSNMVWESGKGWRHGEYTNVLLAKGRLAELSLNWSTAAVVTGVEVELEIETVRRVSGSEYSNPTAAPKIGPSYTAAISSSAWDALSGIETITHSVSPTSTTQVGYRAVSEAVKINQACCGGYVYIRKLKFSGTGNPPQI